MPLITDQVLKLLSNNTIENELRKNHIGKNYLNKLLMFLLALMLTVSHSSAADVTTSNKVVSQGQNFDLNISIDPLGTPIAGAQLNFAFNQSLFRVNSVTEGNLFKRNGESTFFNAGTINNSEGTVSNIFNAIIGTKNVSSIGTFFVVNMTAIGSKGATWINLSNVKVSDPNGQPVPLKIANGSVKINNPPFIAAIGNKVVNEGQALTFTISATDADGDTLTYSASNLPAGASFNSGTRIFQWTPGYTQSRIYPNIQFKVSDGTAAISENISINVSNVNIAPILTLTPANGSTFNETDIIKINITASDQDNDPLSYIIKIDGVQVSTASNYTWVTNYSSSGTHNIEVSVSDGTALVTKNITIYINNSYPRYDVIGNGIVDVADLVIIGQHFNEVVTSPFPRYDVNQDGVVNILDITITAQHFGEKT